MKAIALQSEYSPGGSFVQCFSWFFVTFSWGGAGNRAAGEKKNEQNEYSRNIDIGTDGQCADGFAHEFAHKFDGRASAHVNNSRGGSRGLLARPAGNRARGRWLIRAVSGLAAALRAVVWLGDARCGGDHAGGVSRAFSASPAREIAQEPSRVDFLRGAQSCAATAPCHSAIAGWGRARSRAGGGEIGSVAEPRGGSIVDGTAQTVSGDAAGAPRAGPALPQPARGGTALPRDRTSARHFARRGVGVADASAYAADAHR